MSAAALAISLALTGSACHGRLCDAKALDPYFAALETAKAKGHAPVHVLQIGDSHSAGDNITGARRDALQARFGSGGRGVLPPGRPFEGFVPHEVTVEQSEGWALQTTMSSAAQDPATRPLFGISGYRLSSLQAGAKISMTAEPSAAFTRVTVCAERAPGAGAFVLSFGATTTRVPLDADKTSIGCTTLQSGEPQTYAAVTAEAGTVTLTSWAAFDDNGGVVVSNLGVIGAQLRHFAETDDAAVAEELKAYKPDLIILAYGTNEGFGDSFDSVSYASLLEGQIERLKRLSGGTPILVLGAPDAERKRPEPPQARRRGRHHHRKPFYPWATPAGLAEVRAVQKKVAHEEGVAFWDWAAGMGGRGAAKRWASADPPLMRPDHVHFTAAGGAEIAKALDADLEAAARAWARGR
jgi:lysophospholipase L1-like esterase